mgnify:CR=1 FL=1
MKLLQIANRYYLSVLLIVFLTGSIAAYFILKSIINREFNQKLLAEREQLIFELHNYETLQESYYLNIGDVIDVREVDYDPQIKPTMQDTVMYDPYEKKSLPFRTLRFSDQFQGKNYIITITKSLLPNQDLIEGISEIMIGLVLVLAISLGLLNRVIFKKLWRPFYDIIKQARAFDIAKPKSLDPIDSRVEEFNELHTVIDKMIDKNINDYQRLKEYTENTSHEIQTPLAIIKNKAELLLQEDLTEDQLTQVSRIYEASTRLSRLKEGLSIISRIENYQFAENEAIELTSFIRERLEQLHELIEMKSIKLKINFSEEYTVSINTDLAYMLITNLISNAVKHNLDDGELYLSLVENVFTIQNTGHEPKMATEKLFDRFSKSSNRKDSTGLGLALVKLICDLYGYKITYEYVAPYHAVSIRFSGPQP